ncbi:MAG: phage head-tail joining protein [Paracoccaceae bacterium]
MASVSQLTEWRDRLQSARYSGTRAVQDATGERIEYKSDSEMARALAAIDAEISQLQKRRLSIIRFQTSKGL